MRCELFCVSEDGCQTTRRKVFEHRNPDILGGGIGIGETGEGGKLRLSQIQPTAPEGGGGQTASGAAQEQRALQQGFELREGDGECRLADMQRLGCRRHATVTGDGGGIFQLAQGKG